MHTVIETPSFIAAAAEAGLTRDGIADLISLLAATPDLGAVMPGTGGARKLRMAGRDRGKSGGYRVITFFGGRDIPVFLLDCYGKGDKANLTQAERNELRKLLADIVEVYRSGSSAEAARNLLSRR